MPKIAVSGEIPYKVFGLASHPIPSPPFTLELMLVLLWWASLAHDQICGRLTNGFFQNIPRNSASNLD